MSRRRELLNRISGLSDIRDILAAMKGLALVELRRVGELIEAQRASVEEIATAYADFLQFHREELAIPAPPLRDVYCVVGAERGFCGDFNTRIVQAALERIGRDDVTGRLILVGTKLADSWPETGADPVRVPAPSFADEVPATLAGVLQAVATAIAAEPALPARVLVLHDSNEGIRSRQLLPIPEPALPTRHHAFPPELNLPPRPCFEGLTDHYLYALLHELLFDSLLQENQRRLQHMDQALHRLDDQLEDLQRDQNRQRQEEIIEEIEVILLTAT